VDDVTRPRRPDDMVLFLIIPLALVAITIAIAPVLAMTVVGARETHQPARIPDDMGRFRPVGAADAPDAARADAGHVRAA
jgi:hypothetical protein